MTTPSASDDLAELLQGKRVLLLDFDGPICSIFAGHPAPLVARELLDALQADGDLMPEDVVTLTDPFDVLRYAATLSADAAERTEGRLRNAELHAVPTATATPKAYALVRSWRDAGRQVAVVSNNSESAVRAYLHRRGLRVDALIGRTNADPVLLKPNPHLVSRALAELRAPVAESLLVGDSPSDVEAARRADIATIGYANKPGKRERLSLAGALLVLEDLGSLAVPSPCSRDTSQLR